MKQGNRQLLKPVLLRFCFRMDIVIPGFHLGILRKLCKQFCADTSRASHSDVMLERTQNLRALAKEGSCLQEGGPRH